MTKIRILIKRKIVMKIKNSLMDILIKEIVKHKKAL